MQITIIEINRRNVLFTPAHFCFIENNFNYNIATHNLGKILLKCLWIVENMFPSDDVNGTAWICTLCNLND